MNFIILSALLILSVSQLANPKKFLADEDLDTKTFFENLMALRNQHGPKAAKVLKTTSSKNGNGVPHICGPRLWIYVRKVCREPGVSPSQDMEIKCCFRGCEDQHIIKKLCPEKLEM